MEPSLEEKVREFVSEQTGVSINKINLDTCLFDDLGIDGDDGADFFDPFDVMTKQNKESKEGRR